MLRRALSLLSATLALVLIFTATGILWLFSVLCLAGATVAALPFWLASRLRR